jgi:hypothetical protein
MVPVIPLFILIYLCPESPRFLIRKNRYPEAYHSLRRFRKSEIQACRDFYAIHSQLQVEAEIVRRHTGNRNWYSHEIYQDEVRDMHYWQRIHRLVTRRRNLRASVSSCLCMAAQQLCGVGCFAACSRVFISMGLRFFPNFVRSMFSRSTHRAYMALRPLVKLSQAIGKLPGLALVRFNPSSGSQGLIDLRIWIGKLSIYYSSIRTHRQPWK